MDANCFDLEALYWPGLGPHSPASPPTILFFNIWAFSFCSNFQFFFFFFSFFLVDLILNRQRHLKKEKKKNDPEKEESNYLLPLFQKDLKIVCQLKSKVVS